MPSLQVAVNFTPALQKPGLVIHTCDPSSRRSEVQVCPWLRSSLELTWTSLFPPPRQPGSPLQGSNTVSAGPHMSFMHGCIFREPEPGGVIFGKLRSFWSILCTLDNNRQGIIFLVILCPQHRPLLIGLCHAWVKFQGSCIDYTYHCCNKTLHKSKHKEVSGNFRWSYHIRSLEAAETNAGLCWLGP